MNPGRRRLLIPGLLIALLIVVVLAAAVRRGGAEATPLPIVPHTQVSVINDPRITESSGLAVSQAHPGIAYTVNDSGDDSRVFAVEIQTGRVVGVTSVVNAKWQDAEAIALWGGKLWVADIGNNSLARRDRALYVFDEPGAGDHRVTSTRYPVPFEGLPVDVEAMVIVPGVIHFFSKTWPAGYLYSVDGDLGTDQPNVARPIGPAAPPYATDATVTPDGRFVLVRGPVTVEVRDASTWALRHTDVIPALEQGEALAMESSGRSYLIGSEGPDSPLVRIAFDPSTFSPTPVPPIDPQRLADQLEAERPVRSFLWAHRMGIVLGVVLGGCGLAATVLVWRILRHRRNEVAGHDGA